MKLHRLAIVAILVTLCLSRPAAAQRLDIDQIEESVGYVNDLQNPDGGFRPNVDERLSDLGAVSSGMRALKYLHPRARPRDRETPKEFVDKCFAGGSGGFANRPGDAPDVRATAMGLMAMVELKMPLESRRDAVLAYFHANARSLPDIYIAAAALDAAGLKSAKADEWIATYEKSRNPDGTFGKDAFESAGGLITILRLGGTVPNSAELAHKLRDAQQDDGGFARAGQPSDLATTYRVMRALWMLKEKPNIARCAAFVDKCRNENGGYGMAPGQPSSVSATYFAAIVLHWLEEFEGS